VVNNAPLHKKILILQVSFRQKKMTFLNQTSNHQWKFLRRKTELVVTRKHTLHAMNVSQVSE